jgi:hypothetical protein
VFITDTQDRRPSTTACPGCWATVTNKVKKCAMRKIIFCIGLDIEQPRQDKNLWFRHDEPIEPTNPSQLYSMSPHLPQLHQEERPPLSRLWFTISFFSRLRDVLMNYCNCGTTAVVKRRYFRQKSIDHSSKSCKALIYCMSIVILNILTNDPYINHLFLNIKKLHSGT